MEDGSYLVSFGVTGVVDLREQLVKIYLGGLKFVVGLELGRHGCLHNMIE
jgi:hypothetical protein